MNDFANYLQDSMVNGEYKMMSLVKNKISWLLFLVTLLAFLADADLKTSQCILIDFMTILEHGNLHDFWVNDFGATNYMSNKLSNIYDLE